MSNDWEKGVRMTTDDWKKETSNIGKRRPSRVRKPAVIEEPGAEPNVPEGPNYLNSNKKWQLNVKNY